MTTDYQEAVLTRGELWKRDDTAEGAYAIDGDASYAWLENARSDEVVLHIATRDSMGDSPDSSVAEASFYMSHHEALQLMAAIGKAVLS